MPSPHPGWGAFVRIISHPLATLALSAAVWGLLAWYFYSGKGG